MTTNNNQHSRDLLETRSKRLSKLVKMSAPDDLIGQEVVLILQAAIAHCPDEFFKSMQKWLTGEFCEKQIRNNSESIEKT